jgi:hypothetical protein
MVSGAIGQQMLKTTADRDGRRGGSILMFSHIPKTAGTTFNVLLRSYFGSSLLAARVRKDAQWATYRYADLAKDIRIYPGVRCITGHGVKPFEDFGEFNGRLQWFTFLRDPVARFVSHYVHQQTGDHPQFRMSLADWARRFKRRNWCVRMIAGEEDLPAAKQILKERFSFVGLVEQFDLSVRLFRQVFQLADFSGSYLKPRTVSRNPKLRDDVLAATAEHEAVIQENTDLDRQLYEFVVAEIWQPQVERFGGESRSETPPARSHWSNRANYLLWAAKDRMIYQPFVSVFG